MPEKNKSALFRIIKWLVKVFYPKTSVVGSENLPDEPVLIIGNHCQMNGPIAGEYKTCRYDNFLEWRLCRV